MATHDYIPGSEAERIAWLIHFMMWMDTHGVSHGFSPAEITALDTEVTGADTAYTHSIDLQAAARAGIVAKQDAIADALHLAREDVKRLQASPTMTDADRADAGITVPDTIPTPTDPEAVRELEMPGVLLDWSKPLQVIIHWGLNPHDEHRNARPAETIGCQIQYHRGGIPEHEADWIDLDSDTESPYIHIIHEDTPTTYAYRACWIGKKINRGPYGDPAVCTVSV